MSTKTYSTEDFVNLIVESIGNGQLKQAADQFDRALANDCEMIYLISEIPETLWDPDEFIKFLAYYIKTRTTPKKE